MTNSELDLLETIDVEFLRKLLNAPRGTPKEMLFLELGCIPLREIIRERRLGFLHYILNEDEESMVNKFFKSQLKNRTKKDWVNSVLDDLESLGLAYLSWDQIRSMKKGIFMNLVKEKIEVKAFENLQKKNKSHSKVKQLNHNAIKMQKYLQANQTNIKREEAQLIFKLRCKVTEVKVNLKGSYDYLECGACGLEEESQKHIIQCEKLNQIKRTEEINYDKLFDGTVLEKLKIAKVFKENLKLLDQIKKG